MNIKQKTRCDSILRNAFSHICCAKAVPSKYSFRDWILLISDLDKTTASRLRRGKKTVQNALAILPNALQKCRLNAAAWLQQRAKMR